MSSLGPSRIFSYNLIYSLDGLQGASTDDSQSLQLISWKHQPSQLP